MKEPVVSINATQHEFIDLRLAQVEGIVLSASQALEGRGVSHVCNALSGAVTIVGQIRATLEDLARA